jgi:VanZ family protein
MISRSAPRLAGFCGAILIAAIAADSLVPVAWQVRLGLHWLIEHFLAYFTVSMILCLALQRPILVAGAIMVLAASIEALQGLTADRIPDLPTAVSAAGGALAGATTATLLMRLLRRRKAAHPDVPAVAQPPQM